MGNWFGLPRNNGVPLIETSPGRLILPGNTRTTWPPGAARALLVFAAIFLLVPAAKAPTRSEGVPFVLARALQFDITSKINGLPYRIMVSVPRDADPGATYPVLYVLDGDQMFATASESASEQSAQVFVVGIGYGTDAPDEWFRRRAFDMTPSEVRDGSFAGSGLKTGGGDAFLRVLEEEVRPFVRARYKVDPTRQVLFGKSLSGLIALRALFRNPTAYAGYALSSPAIWVNNREVLNDEEAFSTRARSGELHLRILMMSAGDEQYRGDDPNQLAAAASTRMIDNASDLADRLASLNPANITVSRVIFPGETHVSSSSAALSRAVRLAASLK